VSAPRPLSLAGESGALHPRPEARGPRLQASGGELVGIVVEKLRPRSGASHPRPEARGLRLQASGGELVGIVGEKLRQGPELLPEARGLRPEACAAGAAPYSPLRFVRSHVLCFPLNKKVKYSGIFHST
jgi:hypothetical protein